MAKKDYYEILGVSPDETPNGIRAAFRKLAKSQHPDIAGPENTRRFQDITEAYCILSNPKTRECYNESLRAAAGKPRIKVRRHRPSPGHTHVEPFRGRSSSSREYHPRHFSFFDRPFRWLFDDLLEESIFGTSGRNIQNIEVVLSSDEALRGGTLPIVIAVQCPSCYGSGRVFPAICHRCRGAGRVELAVRIELPANITDNTILEFSLPGIHFRSFLLRVHVRVQNG